MSHYLLSVQVIRVGDNATFVAVLLTGECDVVALNNTKVGRIVPGQVIGELGVFEGGKRSADIVSCSDNTCVAIMPFDGIVSMHMEQPQLGLKLMRVLTHASVSKLQERANAVVAMEKTKKKRKKDRGAHVTDALKLKPTSNMTLFRLLKTASGWDDGRSAGSWGNTGAMKAMKAQQDARGLRKHISDKELEILSRRMSMAVFEAGEVIVSGGHPVKHLMIILEGGAEARMGGAKGRLAHSRKKGELVGEEAFMSGYMAKGSGAKCDIFAVGAQTVKVAVIAREQLNELNMIHPILVFKLIFYAGTVVLGQIKGQLEQLGVTIDDDVNAGSFLQGVMHMLHLSQTEYMRRGDMGAVAGPKRGRKARESTDDTEGLQHAKDMLYDALEGQTALRQSQIVNQVLTRHEAVSMLEKTMQRSAWWHGFSPPETDILAEEMLLLRLMEGETIMRLGEESTFVAVLLEGECKACVRTDGEDTGSEAAESQEPGASPRPASPRLGSAGSRVVGTMHPGDIFGELALFEGGRRQVDVYASTDQTVFAIFNFQDLVVTNMKYPELGIKILQVLTRSAAARLRSKVVSASPRESLGANEVTDAGEEDVAQALESAYDARPDSAFAQAFERTDAALMAPYFRLARFRRNEQVVKRGRVGEFLMIIVEGNLDVRVGGADSELLQQRGPGEYMGEYAFLEADRSEGPTGLRAADVFAGSDEVTVATCFYSSLEKINTELPQLSIKLISSIGEMLVATFRARIDSRRNPERMMQQQAMRRRRSLNPGGAAKSGRRVSVAPTMAMQYSTAGNKLSAAVSRHSGNSPAKQTVGSARAHTDPSDGPSLQTSAPAGAQALEAVHETDDDTDTAAERSESESDAVAASIQSRRVSMVAEASLMPASGYYTSGGESDAGTAGAHSPRGSSPRDRAGGAAARVSDSGFFDPADFLEGDGALLPGEAASAIGSRGGDPVGTVMKLQARVKALEAELERLTAEVEKGDLSLTEAMAAIAKVPGALEIADAKDTAEAAKREVASLRDEAEFMHAERIRAQANAARDRTDAQAAQAEVERLRAEVATAADRQTARTLTEDSTGVNSTSQIEAALMEAAGDEAGAAENAAQGELAALRERMAALEAETEAAREEAKAARSDAAMASDASAQAALEEVMAAREVAAAAVNEARTTADGAREEAATARSGEAALRAQLVCLGSVTHLALRRQQALERSFGPMVSDTGTSRAVRSAVSHLSGMQRAVAAAAEASSREAEERASAMREQSVLRGKDEKTGVEGVSAEYEAAKAAAAAAASRADAEAAWLQHIYSWLGWLCVPADASADAVEGGAPSWAGDEEAFKSTQRVVSAAAAATMAAARPATAPVHVVPQRTAATAPAGRVPQLGLLPRVAAAVAEPPTPAKMGPPPRWGRSSAPRPMVPPSARPATAGGGRPAFGRPTSGTRAQRIQRHYMGRLAGTGARHTAAPPPPAWLQKTLKQRGATGRAA